MQKDSVLGLDGDACGFLGLLQILNRDVRFERFVRQVEADGFGEEVLERHLVDPFGARPCIEMHRCVDMRAGVIAHG